MDHPVYLTPFHDNPLVFAAQKILDHYQAELPDLSACQILVAEEHCAAQLRAELLNLAEQRGFNALLGPSIQRLDRWLSQSVSTPAPVLSRPAQELVLAQALRNASPVYADTDPWLLADQLLDLFDELTRFGIALPQTLDRFQEQLQAAYALPTPNPSLQQEAFILHTLWQAWHEQLNADAVLDPASAYLEQLQQSLQAVGEQMLWLIGFSEFSRAEIHWLRTLLQQDQARLILHGNAAREGYHPDAPLRDMLEQLGIERVQENTPADDDFGQLLDSLFDTPQQNLKRRAQDFRLRHPQDPLTQRLRLYRAESPEQEAQAVALQVRRWLLEGVPSIAIVSEDRRLARRVRALLEASHIELDDTGGWALSTTSAAAMVERWLETVEEDFACAPMLDVLKSAFVCFSDRDQHLMHVRRLEQDIILHENIARGLARYRHHLNLRSERLPDWSEPTRRALQQMLNILDHAAGPLSALLHGTQPASRYLQALSTSLQELGTWKCFESDVAGQRFLEVLQELQQAAAHATIPLRWSEFRAWLGRNLERATFRSASSASPVRLLTLAQSRSQRFSALIMASCSQEQIPGKPVAGAFFNQRVRAQLGLPTWSGSLAIKLHHFCRTLHSADQLLLTYHSQRDAEPVSVSPWLELMEIFHRNAYRNELYDRELGRLLAAPDARPRSPDRAALPGREQRPAPQPPSSAQPASWSASTHQRLIDCPYRFFAADVLGLKPRDEIREALSRSDYGSLVHRILQAFHCKTRGLPGPWQAALDESHREAALELLRRISERVFAEAIAENFQAQSWLKQWLSLLPGYLDWEIQRQRLWPSRKAELKTEKKISDRLTLKGRIDRLDQGDGTSALLDYKTGYLPRTEQVLAGEAVQLPSYALLLEDPVCQLDYLHLGRNGARQQTCADNETLQQLLEDIGHRLTQLDAALQQQATLPAWGDAQACAHCEFTGVCRRDMWLRGEPGHD